MLSANAGSVRRAFSEPSIGSITTRSGAVPPPKTTSPRSSEIAVNSRPGACRRSSSAKTISSASRSITRLRSPPSPTPAYSVRASIPRVRASNSRCAATIRRHASSQCRRRWRSAACSVIGPSRAMLDTGLVLLRNGHTDDRATSGASPSTATGRCSSSGRPDPAAPRRSRCGSRRSPLAECRPERVLVLTRSRAARPDLRDRAEALLDRPHEELWIHTYEEAAERLLREYALEAGLDPFFATVGPADRLAILLDHLDELPLRRHEIRGNPAGLLARLLRRIDLLKAEAVAAGRAARLGGRRGARRLERGGARAGRARDRVRRPLRAPRSHPARGRQPRRRRPGRSSSAGCSRDRPDVAAAVARALRPRARRRARGCRGRPRLIDASAPSQRVAAATRQPSSAPGGARRPGDFAAASRRGAAG